MEISCKFDFVDWSLIQPKKVYTCIVTSCDIKSRVSIAAFKGTHELLRSNKDVQAVWFHDTAVRYIPKNLNTIFPNLAYLLIWKCDLQEVTFEDMVGLEKLEALWLSHNQIEVLPLDLFTKMPKLKEFGIKGNKIRDFNLRVLEPIRNTIERFNIQGNPGIDQNFEKANHKRDSIENFMLAKSEEDNATNFRMISMRLEQLFLTSKHSDSTIKVGDKEFKVHKCILASQSSFFDKMFSDEAAENATRTVNKPKNFNQETFEVFLRYFYTKNIPSPDIVVDLLELAIEFGVTDLKDQCADLLCKTINPRNACQLYHLALLHSLPILKMMAFAAIRKMHPEISYILCDKPDLVDGIIETKIAMENY